MLVSIDVYDHTVINLNIFKSIIEARSDYPEYRNCTWRQYLLLQQEALTSYVVVATDAEGNQGYCIYDTNYEDPHMVGAGTVMMMTLSNSSACTKAIMRHILRTARATRSTWVYISHRVSHYTYRGTFHKLK